MSKRTGRRDGTTLAFGIILVLAAAALLFAARQAQQKERRCVSSTSAVVTNVSKERKTEKSGKKKRVYYEYSTDYRYEVNEESYYGNVTLSEGQRKEEGDQLTVHYNPDEPKEHFTNYRSSSLSMKVIAGISGGIGVICVIGYIFSGGRRKYS